MGWALWLVETALCLFAALVAAGAIYPERGLVHRLVAALLIAPALILVVIQACGIFDQLNPISVGVVGLLVFGGCLAIAFPCLGVGRLTDLVARDVQTLRETARDVVREREIGILNAVLAFAIFALGALVIWVFRSWDWDCLVYHKTITDFTIQKKSLQWIDAYAVVAAFPRNIEWLAAWNCLFQRDNRLDDSSQWPYGLLACLLIMAWARRLGTQRPFATALGSAWIALPPVFLQLTTSHNDIACAALLGATLYFFTEPVDSRSRWMILIAMGTYLGTKLTALIPCLVIAPWLLARIAIEIHRRRAHCFVTSINVALSFLALASVGLFKYIQNAIHTGNPFYPYHARIPLIGLELAGPMDSDRFDGDPGVYIFQGMSVAKRVVLSWFSTEAVYWPDVRIGGFGPLFAWILLPAFVAMLLSMFWLRRTKAAVPILMLFFLPLALPAAWWPRYILATSIAGLLALAFFHSVFRQRWIRLVLSVLLVIGTGFGFYRALSKAEGPGWKELRTAFSSSPVQRATLQLVHWQWPTSWALLKEEELRQGDGVAYDDGIAFPAELFSADYRTRVIYLPSEGNPAVYLQKLREFNVKWVAVMAGSPAERAVRAEGGQYLFTPYLSSSNIYRLVPAPPSQGPR